MTFDEEAGEQPGAPDEAEPSDIPTAPTNFQEKPSEEHPELVNIAESLDEDELQTIAELVVSEFEQDDTSRQPWLDKHAEWIKIFNQIDKPLNPPWRGASSETIPILSEACNQFHARAVRAFLSTPDIVRAVPIGHVSPADLDRADRVGKHMSWQLTVQDQSYFRNKDRLLASLPLHGQFFTKVYRDPVRKINRVENVRAEDLVVPYGIGPRDIEDIERKTHVIWLSQARTIHLAAEGFFCSPGEPFEAGNVAPTQAATDEATGVQPNDDTSTTKNCKILEQHRFLDLDGDSLEEPYIVWVDAQSRKVLRIALRYEVFSEDVLDHPPVDPTTGQPATDPMTGLPPQPKVLFKKGQPSNYKEPIEYFTSYQYLVNPDGFYGLSLGHLVGNTNKACNKLLRQVIDAGTLANTRTGFISKSLSMKKGPLEIEQGKLVTLDAMVQDIKSGIYMLDYPGPNQGLISMLELLKSSADRLAGSTEILTGAPDKVMQPTTVMALIDQGLMQFSAVQQRVHASWQQELMKLFRLNSIYLDEKEYFAINDLTGAQQGEVEKADYANDLQISPRCDVGNVTRQQQISKAQAEWEWFKEPLVQHAIAGDVNAIYHEGVRFLKAIGSNDIDAILPDPSKQQRPPPPKPPEQLKIEGNIGLEKVRQEYETEIEKLKQTTLLEIARMKAEVDIEMAKMKVGIPVGPIGDGQTGQIGYPPMAGASDNPVAPPANGGAVQSVPQSPQPPVGNPGGPPEGAGGSPLPPQ